MRGRLTVILLGMLTLASEAGAALPLTRALERTTAQTNAALKSTHAVSGQTAQGIRDMANAFENLNATMDDTTIQAGASPSSTSEMYSA